MTAARSACLISLGCAKNLVDSETVIPQLLKLGYVVTTEPSEAELIVVNTCGFIESAVQEAIDHLLDAARYKTVGRCRILVALGCMVQRYGKKLAAELPEVDLFLGTSHYRAVGTAVGAFSQGDDRRLYLGPPGGPASADTPRILSTGVGSAFIKIAEGCDNRCSFCMIPRLRGRYRSRTVEDVLHEASRLAAAGAVELNLIAQDVSAFGTDRGEPDDLLRLLSSLEEVDGLQWIRLLYLYPDRIGDGLLRAMAASEKIVPYLDLPFQHVSPSILSAMRRGGEFQRPEEVVRRIRDAVPGVALRTSLMVGFPGETEADFEALLRFVETAKFEHLGVFAYSPEAGSRAARFPGQVAEAVKEHRRDVLLEMQRGISRSLMENLVGSTARVFVCGPHPETDLLLAGRLATQAPEVDGTVIITEGEAEAGRIVTVEIVKAHDYDVEARILLNQ